MAEYYIYVYVQYILHIYIYILHIHSVKQAHEVKRNSQEVTQ